MGMAVGGSGGSAKVGWVGGDRSVGIWGGGDGVEGGDGVGGGPSRGGLLVRRPHLQEASSKECLLFRRHLPREASSSGAQRWVAWACLTTCASQVLQRSSKHEIYSKL